MDRHQLFGGPMGVTDWGRPLSPGKKAQLMWEILASYAVARGAMRTNKLAEAASRVRRIRGRASPRVAPEDRQYAALHLASAVNRVLGKLPTDSRCLARSLVLTSLLAHRGIDSSLVIGVRSEPEFAAHAWVELDGRALLPPGDQFMQRMVEV